MAKKSSNNAVKKLDKQIKDLENSIKEDKSETLPVLDKKKIEEEMKKPVTTKSNKKGKFEKKENSNKQKKSKENKKSSNIRENIIVNDKKYKKKMKNNRPIRDTIVAVDSNKKKVDNTKTIDKEKIKEELELKKDAKEMSCSKPCISHICKVLGIKPVRKFRSKQICERDEMIKKLVSEGYTYENVGKAMGITRQRIEQIINKKKN